jgi:8-oxo-dGTP pyrophosphatase MutT (NUDIX family)
MRDTTLIFLVKRFVDGNKAEQVSEICLAMKKRGFGVGRWNGVGGKLNPGESIEQAAIREAYEEIGVKISSEDDLKKTAELEFLFADPQKSNWNQLVHVYFCKKWEGEPVESEEMKPEWFRVSEIPFKNMWPDDPFWLPKVIAGNFVEASFTFGDGDAILKQRVDVRKGTHK